MIHYRDVERNDGIYEEIPLNCINSGQVVVPHKQLEMKKIFDKYDIDKDGFLSIREMKELIKRKQSEDLPKEVVNCILKSGDINGDGKLDFDEFWKFSLQHEWMFNKCLRIYCKHVVPPRQSFNKVEVRQKQILSCWPPPLTMVIFSIIEIIMFLIDIICLRDENTISKMGQSVKGPAATLFIYNPYTREKVWRFVTYMFVHVGVMHIAMNLIVQIFLGVALELVHDWWRVSLVYIAGVLAGSMGTSISDPHIFLAGASGGVYALITAHVATIILNWKEMKYPGPLLFVFLLFICIDLGTSINNHLTKENDQIGYIAHLCGAIAGLLVGIGVLRNLEVESWEKKLWWCAVTIYGLLMFIGVCIHIFCPDRFP